MVATLQTVPPLASRHNAAQKAAADDLMDAVRDAWLRQGPRFDAAWRVVAPLVVAEVLREQRAAVDRAAEYVPVVLEATGQAAAAVELADPVFSGLVGVTGAGYAVEDSLSVVSIRAKQAVASGATPLAAMESSGFWLASSVGTILADTGRAAEGLAAQVRPVRGYVRMVSGGACGRCVILAGKWFRKNQGFPRHPRCRCTHIPAAESTGDDWTTDPKGYFNSLNDEQQIKLMGSKANAQAVRDGADMNQIVNAYRRKGSVRVASDGTRFTIEGRTRRALGGQRMAAAGVRGQRLMPEAIYTRTRSQAEALRLLRDYGWIV